MAALNSPQYFKNYALKYFETNMWHCNFENTTVNILSELLHSVFYSQIILIIIQNY